MNDRYLVAIAEHDSAIRRAFVAATIILSTYFFPSARPFFIVGAIAALIFLHQDSTDRHLLFAVGVLGFGPALGWIGGLNKSIDVVTVIAALSLSSSVTTLGKKNIRLNLYVSQAAIAGLITYLWWRPITNGSRNDLLARMFGGWDHFGHYYLFISAKVHHKFVAFLPNNIPNSTVFNKKYPAGIHMSWAQWWRDMGPELEKYPSFAIHQYLVSVVITVAICTTLIVIAIARVAETQWIRTLSATGATILFLAFICFGHLSMTIWSGFPNFIVAITGMIIVGSVAIKRSQSAWRTMIIIAGASAMTTYNWFPLILPVAPIAVLALWKESRRLAQESRLILSGILIILAITIVAPMVQALALGADHLAIPGGINNLPVQYIVLVLVLGVAIGLIQLSRDFTFTGLLKASPLLLAGIFQLMVSIPIRMRDGAYPYYPQKIAYGMVFLVLTTSCIFVIQWLEAKWQNDSLKTKFIQGLALLVGCAAFAQAFGYVGVDWTVLAGGNVAPGISQREAVVVGAVSKHRISTIILGLEEATRDSSLLERDCLVLDDTEMQEYDPVLINYWVGTLTWTLTEEHLSRAQELIALRTGQADPVANAQVINKLLSLSTDCPVVTRPVASALIYINPRWAPRIWTIESDGHVSRYQTKD